ncbi:hypothetical protein Tco_0633877 [Tanacetum coccineum]
MYAILRGMDYARALVDIRVGRALKDTMMISVPSPVFCHDDTQCPKRVIANLRNLRKHGGMSNDGFQIVQRNDDRDHLVSKIGRERCDEIIMSLVEFGSANFFIFVEFPEPITFREDENSIFRDLQESDDGVDVENGYDEITTSSKSLASPNSSPNGKCKTKNGSEQKLEANVPNDADYDVWLPLDSVHKVNDIMKNLLYEEVEKDSEDEIKYVDNEMASYLASKPSGLDMDIPENIQSICDNLDIKVRGRMKK